MCRQNLPFAERVSVGGVCTNTIKYRKMYCPQGCVCVEGGGGESQNPQL